MVNIDKEVMNLYEAAQFLGVRPVTVWDYARRWIIRGKKVGTEKWYEWEFARADLLWLHERRYNEEYH
ncbi:MAG: excisionase [Deltaproteobacteria bacterium]